MSFVQAIKKTNACIVNFLINVASADKLDPEVDGTILAKTGM